MSHQHSFRPLMNQRSTRSTASNLAQLARGKSGRTPPSTWTACLPRTTRAYIWCLYCSPYRRHGMRSAAFGLGPMARIGRHILVHTWSTSVAENSLHRVGNRNPQRGSKFTMKFSCKFAARSAERKIGKFAAKLPNAAPVKLQNRWEIG